MAIYYESELYHHGVKGMRWGHRKARPISAMGNSRKQPTLADKKNAQWKSTRNQYVKSQSGGKRAVKFLLGGATGAHAYNTLRASGKSRAVSAGATVASSLVGGPIGNVALDLLVSSDYKDKH